MDSKYAGRKFKKNLNKLKMKSVPLGYKQSYGIISFESLHYELERFKDRHKWLFFILKFFHYQLKLLNETSF